MIKVLYKLLYDATVFNPVIGHVIVARFTSILRQSHDLQKIPLTQKEDLLERRYLTGSMSLLTFNRRFNT